MNAIVNATPIADPSEIMEAVLLAGDLSKLSSDERTSYYLKTCSSLGLNPYTKPLDYIKLSGREVLYATKGCADQLRSLHRISLEITDRRVIGDMLTVTAKAVTPDGRTDEDVAAISIKGLAGEALANATMKAVTKAKRRVTLSICGLGMLDETEVQSVLEVEREAAKRPPRSAQPALEAPKTEKPPIEINLRGGWEPARFPRTGPGLKEALKFLEDGVTDGSPEVVGDNNELLDTIAEKLPQLAERVANLRAAAAEALAPKDEPEEPDTFVRDFVGADDDDFPGDIPPK
jgi:hypothetical protein